MFYEIFAIPVALGVQMTYVNAFGIQPNPSTIMGAIFNGSEIITTGLYSGELQITTKLAYSSGDETYMSTAGSASTDNPHVELIWAHNTINKLLQQSIINPEDQVIKDEIVDIAVNYGIVVPDYTGLTIVLEEKLNEGSTETEGTTNVNLDYDDGGNIGAPAMTRQATETQEMAADDAGFAPVSLASVLSAFMVLFTAIRFRKRL
jgi:hypothetical protein